MAACCPPGSWPQLLRTRVELDKDDSAFPPKGKVVTLPTSAGGAELPLYVVTPTITDETPPKGAIMILPDIYSVRFLQPTVPSGDRIGAIADTLADAGYLVAIAGIFRDQPVDVVLGTPEDGDYSRYHAFARPGGVDWFKANNYAKLGPDVQACANYLLEQLASHNGPKGLAAIGFCFGTWLFTKASAMGDVAFSCAVGYHPATKLESAVFGGDEAEMLGKLSMPTKFLCAGNDSPIYKADGIGKAALEKTGGGVVEFSDMLHGWVSRGDTSDANVKRDVEKAIEETISFLSEKMPQA